MSKTRVQKAAVLLETIWTACCALAMLSQTRTLFGIPRRLDILAAFVFFSTLLTYNFSSEKIWRRYVGWACVLPLGFLFWFLPRPQQGLNLALGACWLLYYGLGRPGQAGLRAFPLAKPVLISIVWAASTVLLPLPPDLWASSWRIFLGRASFIFALALAYDLHDRQYDRQKGLVTIANTITVHQLFRVMYIFLFVSACFVALNWRAGLYSLPSTLALWASLLLSAWLLRRLFQHNAYPEWRKIIIDGLMILQWLLV